MLAVLINSCNFWNGNGKIWLPDSHHLRPERGSRALSLLFFGLNPHYALAVTRTTWLRKSEIQVECRTALSRIPVIKRERRAGVRM